jgi:hypothetical protein
MVGHGISAAAILIIRSDKVLVGETLLLVLSNAEAVCSWLMASNVGADSVARASRARGVA